MSRWTTEAVLAEFRRWVWVPGDATVVRTERLHLYVRRGEATLLAADASGMPRETAPDAPASGTSPAPPEAAPSATPSASLDSPSATRPSSSSTAPPANQDRTSADSTTGLVEEVRSVAAAHGARSLLWTVWPHPDPPNLAGVLRAAGGVEAETLDVCSYDLTDGLHIPVPPGIDAHAATTAEEIWAAHRIRSAIWPEFDLPSQADVDREVDEGGGRFIAYYDGRPAGCAGHEIAGETIRLWGGGVLPEFRGKGVYRGLVSARLADAAKQGGSLAIVHARTGTSAPILRRLGFTVHGQSVVYRLPVSS